MAENSGAAASSWWDPAWLLSSLGHAVIATDLAGVVRYWNPAAERLYGWTAEEALGRNIVELTVPQVSLEMADEIMQALRAGGRWSGGFMVQRKDGSTFPALVTDTGLRSGEGELLGLIGVSADIGHGLRVLLARSSDAALILTRQGLMHFLSPTASALFGWQESEVRGRSLWDYIHPDDRPAAARYFQLVRDSAGPLGPLECRLRCGNRSWRWVEIVMTNLLDDPAVRGVVCNLHDVTERRRDRDQLAELSNQLQTALTSRIVIEQAKGYVAARAGIAPDAAFDVIRRYARNHNRRLVEVAQAVLAGDLPGIAD